MIIRIPDQPQTLTELVKTGFQVWKGSLKQAMPFALTLVIANLIYQMISYILVGTPSDEHEHFGLNIISVIFTALFVILNVAIIYSINRAMNHETLKWKEGLQVGCQKAFPFIVVNILYVMGVLGGFVLLIVPGIMVFIYIMFAPYIVIISNKGIFDSIRESFRLVSGNWRYTVVASLVLLLVFFTFFIFLGVVVLVFHMFLVLSFVTILGSVSSYQQECLTLISVGVLIMVSYPLYYAFILVLLYDLQVRKNENSKYQSFQA